MSEQTAEATATEPNATEEAPKPKPTETVEFWKQKAREQEARAKANADAATKLASLEESQKTETQRLIEERDALKAERDSVRSEALRVRVAVTKGLPADLADRLRGATEDELSEDADRLLELLKPTGSGRFGDADLGVRKTTPPAKQDERQTAAALFGAKT